MASCDLPEDLVIQILLWLPVMSLLRFKSVCKSWCAVIENSSFIFKHLNRAENHLIAMRCRDRYDKVAFFLLFGKSVEVCINLDFPFFKEDSQESFEVCINRDSPFFKEVRLQMVASCNGIICLHDQLRGRPFITNRPINLVLWNPATKELRALPEPSCPSYIKRSLNFGFGFDSKANDYKVVRITIFWDELGRPVGNQVEVYSLSLDSWRRIDAILPVKYIMTRTESTADLNGTYRWCALYECDDDNEVMLTFDLCKELFRTTPLPVSRLREKLHKLLVLRESIALSVILPEDEDYLEVWVLNEHGVKDSWTKAYVIGPIFQLNFCLEFSMNGVLFFTNGQGSLGVCDPDTGEIKYLGVQGGDALEVVLYKESLVSIKGSGAA